MTAVYPLVGVGVVLMTLVAKIKLPQLMASHASLLVDAAQTLVGHHPGSFSMRRGVSRKLVNMTANTYLAIHHHLAGHTPGPRINALVAGCAPQLSNIAAQVQFVVLFAGARHGTVAESTHCGVLPGGRLMYSNHVAVQLRDYRSITLRMTYPALYRGNRFISSFIGADLFAAAGLDIDTSRLMATPTTRLHLAVIKIGEALVFTRQGVIALRLRVSNTIMTGNTFQPRQGMLNVHLTADPRHGTLTEQAVA